MFHIHKVILEWNGNGLNGRRDSVRVWREGGEGLCEVAGFCAEKWKEYTYQIYGNVNSTMMC